ncbi:MAG: hypothetical protein H8F28_07940 [Fibrella sp.]|nr:hypothetical protein [Armatimonadota bacterium]
MRGPRFCVLSLLITVLFFLGRGAAARVEEGTTLPPPEQSNFEFHNRDTGESLPLRSMKSRTTIQGPVALTNIEFAARNDHEKPIEVAVTFEVPRGTVLTKFGYFYGDRFIPGKMYDKGEAWKIYSAVTSRGRDPGIMDRVTATNYHAQIFPVAPKRDLRVHVTLVQMLQTSASGLRFELPLVQGTPGLYEWNATPFAVEARVAVAGRRGIGAKAVGETDGGKFPFAMGRAGTYRTVTFQRDFAPRKNLVITVPHEEAGAHAAVYSAMVGGREGYYAATIVTPKRFRDARVRLVSDGLTGMSLPTRFGDTDRYGQIHIMGRYSQPGVVRLSLRGKNGARFTVPIMLSANRVKSVVDNPAASLWADKRIAAMQMSGRRNFQPDIIRVSQRFMVVSNFTALLAIPQEELEYYRNVLAKQKVQTNTEAIGGGGGDPYIAVHAPEDATLVVALFPDGDVKNLVWNPAKNLWDGRFDIPFGTPEGEYRVTIIVVHKSGMRTRFALVYQNRLTGPTVNRERLETLTAERGHPVSVSVEGRNIARATVVTPWGERVAMVDGGKGRWQGEVTVPVSHPAGGTTVTVILLDGAHNSTEVTLDLQVE